jgi:hypothetical protein
MSFNLRPSTFGFVVGTRVALAFGLGLLVASRIPESRRRQLGLALVGLGAATTVPAARMLFRSRTPAQPLEANGARAEFGFVRAL